MYIKLTSGVPENYSIGQLRRDNPQTSFPKNIPDHVLADFDVYPLKETPKPTVDHTKNVAEGVPVQQDGQWVQAWNVTDATAEEIAERTTNKSIQVRSERDQMLLETDWTQGKDIPDNISQSFVAYRQALRDIPQQAVFPWNVNWPTQP